jgi:hypothetical protein
MNATLLLIGLIGGTALGQPGKTVFKAPRIEVKTEHRDGKPCSMVFYNRVSLGMQFHKSNDEPDLNRIPTTYFHDKGPIGLILKDPKWFPAKEAPPVAVLGMDIGTLAAYAKKGQTFHFTERVPTFVKLSFPDKDEKRYFTFVPDAKDRGADIKIFEGEPREMLEKHGKANFYKVIVVETYKLPVIEVHKELMTKEGLQLLMSKTCEDGIVAFHTSNRYYLLPPIIASAANDLKLACVVGRDTGYDYDDRKNSFRYSSEWVMVARDAKYLAHLKKDDSNRIDWHPPRHELIKRGKLVERKFDKDFLWTDKGQQSFRGLYVSDPEIDKLQDVLYDTKAFLANRIGFAPRNMTYLRAMAFLQDAIRAWGAASADRLNSGPPAKKDAPKIEKN